MNSAHINRRKTSVESGGAGNLVNNGPQPINKDKVIDKKIKNENQRQRINRHNNAVGIKVDRAVKENHIQPSLPDLVPFFLSLSVMLLLFFFGFLQYLISFHFASHRYIPAQ